MLGHTAPQAARPAAACRLVLALVALAACHDDPVRPPAAAARSIVVCLPGTVVSCYGIQLFVQVTGTDLRYDLWLQNLQGSGGPGTAEAAHLRTVYTGIDVRPE